MSHGHDGVMTEASPPGLAALREMRDENLAHLAWWVELEQIRRVTGSRTGPCCEAPELLLTSYGCLRQEPVYCGKRRCHGGRDGMRHGPRWYRYYRHRGRVRRQCIGETLPGWIPLEIEPGGADDCADLRIRELVNSATSPGKRKHVDR